MPDGTCICSNLGGLFKYNIYEICEIKFPQSEFYIHRIWDEEKLKSQVWFQKKIPLTSSITSSLYSHINLPKQVKANNQVKHCKHKSKHKTVLWGLYLYKIKSRAKEN